VPASIIGIRSEWRCAICHRQERVVQVVRAGSSPVLDLPRDWREHDGKTYCPAHLGIALPRAAEPEKMAR
jgi:hypothetical protein